MSTTSTPENEIQRRCFMKKLLAGAAGIASASLLKSTSPLHSEPLQKARESMNDLKISDIKTLKLKFPGKTPVKWNSIVKSGGGAPSFKVLELYTNQGIIGRSISKGSRSTIKNTIFPRVKGENPFFVERIWERMYRHNRKPVAKGDYIKGTGSIDIAVWDIIGKALDMPVYKILGGYDTKVRVYAAGGYYQEGKTVSDLVKEMEDYVDQGFRAVKMKVGGASFTEDVERVRAVREGIGPDINLLIDANNKWHAYEAIRFGRAVEKYDLFWFEEPVVPDDFVGCAEVKRALDIPITAGENEFTRWGCREFIQADSADIWNFDTVKAGGITECRKIAAMASAFHIPVSPHGNPHMSAHLLASTPNTLIMETYPGVKSRYYPILPLFPVKDGYITVSDKPGLGLEFDRADIKKYSGD